MIRVSPGLGPSAPQMPSRAVRTPAADEGATFEDALGTIAPPVETREPERSKPEPKRKDDAEPAQNTTPEGADNCERTEPVRDAKPVNTDRARDASTDGGADSEKPVHPVRTEPAPVRTATGAGEVRVEVQAPIAPGVHLRGPGAAQTAPTPGGTNPVDGEPVASSPVPATVPSDTANYPEVSAEAGPETRPGDGTRPVRRNDFERARPWPRNLGTTELGDRPMSRFVPTAEPDVAPEGSAVAARTPADAVPVVRTPDAPGGTEVRPAGADASGARTTVSQQAGQNSGGTSHSQGDGSQAQWQAQSGSGALRADDAARRVEAGGFRTEESPQQAPVRTGAEPLGILGLGRAPVAPKGASTGAGTAASAERPTGSAGLEGAVTRGFSAVMRQNGGSVVIRLSPESLGPVRISMNVDATSVSVMLEAGTAKAHELLSQSLGSLRQSLEAHGLRVDRMGVTLSPPHTAGTGPTADGAMHQRGSEDPGFGDQDAADGRSRGHADQESRDRRGGDLADSTPPFGTFSELFESSGTALRFVATA